MILENNTNFNCEVDLSPEDFIPVTKQAQQSLITMRENTSYWKDAWRRLKENKIAMIAIIAIILLKSIFI